MQLLTASVGSYPRIGDSHELQLVRRSMRRWELGKIGDEELEEAHRQSVRWAIEEQEAAGLDVVTDGLARWYDQYSHVAARLSGCGVNGLVRFADTNCYIREAVVKGRIGWDGPILRPEFDFAAGVAGRPVKMILCGPLTMAHHSINESGEYGSVAELADAYAKVFAREVADLVEAGCDHIQIDEPLIHQEPGWFEIMARGLEIIAERKGGAELSLSLCFGDAAPVYERLQHLPVDVLHLDFTYSETLPEVIASQGSDKRLGLGLLDGRNTRLESAGDLLPVLEMVAGAQEEAFLCPSCGLEYLPRDRARGKLERLVEIRDEFMGGGK